MWRALLVSSISYGRFEAAPKGIMDTKMRLDPELAAKVHFDQLDRLCRRTIGGSAGALVFAFVMAWHLAGDIGTAIWFWFGAKVVVGLVRLCFSFFWKSRRATPLSLDRWLLSLRMLLLADGVVLGSVCVFALMSSNPKDAFIWSGAALCGISAVAISTLESDWICSVCYCGSMLLLTAACLAIYGQSFGVSSAIGIIIFGSVLLLNARTAYKDEEQRLLQGHAIAKYQVQIEETLRVAQRESKTRVEFISSVTHELRTPLHGILGLTTQVMKEGAGMTATQIEHAARMIKRSGEHLLGLINDILDVSKFQAMGVVLSKEVFDLQDVLVDVEAMCFMIAREKGVVFSVKNALPTPYFVHSDPRRLRQILLNLIGNGIKFTDNSGVVRLLVGKSAPQGEFISFVVEDSGIGIAPDKLDNIFEPFTQVAHDRSINGSGLGLSITKRLVSGMNGSVTVTSVLGSGSTFTVSLPLEKVVVSERLRSGADVGNVVPQRLSGYVVVADDDPVTALLSVEALKRVGLRVDHFPNGEGAVEQAALLKGRPDLVLMDCEMPLMDGFTAARKIREMERLSGLKRILIIAATGLVGYDDEQRIIAAGMDDYISKPFESEALVAVVAKHLKGSDTAVSV